MLLQLLDHIPTDQEIVGVTAYGALDTRKCRAALAGHDAAAIIPPVKNAKPRTPDSARGDHA